MKAVVGVDVEVNNPVKNLLYSTVRYENYYLRKIKKKHKAVAVCEKDDFPVGRQWPLCSVDINDDNMSSRQGSATILM